MYSLNRRFPLFSITLTKQLLIFGLVVLGTTTIVLPHSANAFWPFSTNTRAAVVAYTPDSRPSVLAAATNTDPNPDKGLGASIQTSGSALVANAGPSGTIADVASTASSGRISVYVVRPGDTLSDIAGMFEVSVNTIVWANNLGGARVVHPGDTLIILPVSGIERTVTRGDTLKSLANKYGADAGEIADYNGLDAASSLVVGSTIIIPGGEIIAPVVAAPKPRAPSGTGGSFLAGYYSNPVPGAIITQGIHGWNGVDIGSARGTPVHAAADGTIIIAKSNGGWNGGYGNYVVIAHTNGTQTLYSHMSSSAVSPGQSVSSGQVIGYVGTTGRTTGPHLHFEVRGAANPLRSCSVGRVCSAQ